ncbi:MAG: S24 family peptidase [Dehalococcoidia bacterium]|nr:S24 family peptidase [Dehalococcoidia bacterium]
MIVDRDASPRVGDVVTVLVDGDDVQVKRFGGQHGTRVTLTCENPAYPPTEVEDVKVTGVVIQITKTLRE